MEQFLFLLNKLQQRLYLFRRCKVQINFERFVHYVGVNSNFIDPFHWKFFARYKWFWLWFILYGTTPIFPAIKKLYIISFSFNHYHFFKDRPKIARVRQDKRDFSYFNLCFGGSHFFIFLS
jgi:hypothetical protein